MLNRMKIGVKIQLLGVTQLLLMLIMGMISLSQMSKIGTELVDIAEIDIPLSNQLTLITEHQLEKTILVERLLFHTALLKLDAGTQSGLNETKQKIRSLSSKIEKELVDTEKFVASKIGLLHTEAAKADFQTVLKGIKNVETEYKVLKEKVSLILERAESLSGNELALEASELEVIDDKIQLQVIGLLEKVQQFTLAASLKAEQDEQTAIVWIATSIGIAALVGLIMPFIIGRSITQPINTLVARLDEIGQGDGDLTVSLDDSAKDETGDVARSFNQFLSVLRKLISETNSQADVLGESSEIALKAMRETESNVLKQHGETEMVATAVTQMSQTTQDVAKNAAHAASVTREVNERVDAGQKAANETQDIMRQLVGQVDEASQVISNLVSETNNIGSVLEAIDGIAEQTNLLALNAAIEAARAGESGRGFAVVADEVRTLAQRTQTSTVNIQELLTRLKAEANNAVSSMGKGSESANVCLEKSARTSDAFNKTSMAVREISDLNAQIATAAEEQSVVAEEINKNLVNISTLAEVTSQGAKDTSGANSNIAKRLIDLHSNLNAFVV